MPLDTSSFKVVHLTSAHNRNDGRIFHRACVSLAAAGFSTTLVVADGMGSSVVSGVTILDVGLPKHRFDRMFSTTRKIFEKAILESADLYHFHDPELIPIGIKLKRNGFKVIYDIHEDLAVQIRIKSYIPRVLRILISKVFYTYERWASKYFDHLVVPIAEMAGNYQGLAPVSVIENFPKLNFNWQSGQAMDGQKGDKLIIFHAGALSVERGLLNMLNVAALLPCRYDFVLAGPIQPQLLDEVKLHPGWHKIRYLGVIKSAELVSWYEKSFVGIILFNNVGQYSYALATKLYEYLLFGIPVILPNFGAWANFNLENECGINVPVDVPHEIISSLEKLAGDKDWVQRLGSAGRAAAKTKYTWSIAEARLVGMVQKVISTPRILG